MVAHGVGKASMEQLVLIATRQEVWHDEIAGANAEGMDGTSEDSPTC